jgi:hypothetical protein
MVPFHLPVSRLNVLLRQPAGEEDLLLAEASACDTALALTLVNRLARSAHGEVVDFGALSITDLDASLLGIRRMMLGDLIRTDVVCGADGCGARVDVGFRITDYLAHHRPRRARGVAPAGEAGWFVLEEAEVSFRLPSGADQAAILHAEDAMSELTARCLKPHDVPARVRRRIESAMEALAPSLRNDLEGLCPECHSTVSAPFDPQHYVLRELRDHGMFLYEEVHLLASHYHWSEPEILALPGPRRARYAEMVHTARGRG